MYKDKNFAIKIIANGFYELLQLEHFIKINLRVRTQNSGV